jgi:hypothetical protein
MRRRYNLNAETARFQFRGEWERYGRDEKNLSHAEPPVFIGVLSDDGREGR